MSYVAILLEQKLAISNFCHWNDYFHPEMSASSYSILVGKRSLLICFKNCLQLQCSAIRYFSL